MSLGIDNPPLYDEFVKETKNHMSNVFQSWLSTFVQTVTQKFFAWQVVTDVSVNMQINNGYFANQSQATWELFTLPAQSDVGDVIALYALNANGWQVVQGQGQYIQFQQNTSTVGPSGYLRSQHIGDCVYLTCAVANSVWCVISHEGSLSLA